MFESHDDMPWSGPPANVSALAGERRHGARHIAVMRVAKLHTRHGEELCLVRNISAGGLMANIWSDLAIGDPLTAEFKSGHRASGRVVWRRENRIGMQFDEEADVATVLGGDEDPAPGFHPRAPRINIAARARLRCGARYYAIDLRDISQGGARITSADPDVWEKIDGPIVLSVTGLPPIEGTARWHDASNAGLAFNTPIPLDTIARWIAQARG
ncbi:MAG: PilZ domain-containing protein [Sphingomonas sp.]|uniref:PilZ domain-containing protein n=1 Tax=Sphingomonas sp. TaxID=28214 RepID=UPI003F811342